MQLIQKFRIPAIFCAFAVLLSEIIARPYANMGICDDGPYILIARTVASTGHVIYNGWPTAMLGWQLYLAAAFIKLFGFSFTTVRMSTLLVAATMAFVLQRTLVRCGINERNATLGTLALVLSPMYLMLSVTFMTDIQGLFAIVLCFYGCLRALQAASSRAAIGWLCFAVAANAVGGTARQVAWLGTLVMVPSALWLLRSRRGILLAGASATVPGAAFIFGCMLWYKHQPYSVPENLILPSFPIIQTLQNIANAILDLPFLLLPVMLLFIPAIGKSSTRVKILASTASVGYLVIAILTRHHPGFFRLEPTGAGPGSWVGRFGVFDTNLGQSAPPIFLNTEVQILLTIAVLASLCGLLSLQFRTAGTSPELSSSSSISLRQLGYLHAPFAIAYGLLLVHRATAPIGIPDRYLLVPLMLALIWLVRCYQDRVSLQFPSLSILFVALAAVYGVAVTHNMFALYRARVALAGEVVAGNVPETSMDNGWEYNLNVELRYTDHLDVIPSTKPGQPPPPPADSCLAFPAGYVTPHIHPLYGASFDPRACYGPSPFAPVQYSRWLATTPSTLYAVRYTPPTAP